MSFSNFVRDSNDILAVCVDFAWPSLQDQFDLVNRKLAIAKEFGDKVLFKYHRNVMYDYSWNKSSHLMECRGHVYDLKTGELLVAPPRKSFNYLENGWWSDVPLDTPVFFNKKYNGFLACVSTFDETVNVTTTGSLDSSFTGYAREVIPQMLDNEMLFDAGKHSSFHLEILHKDDPHIVDDGIGYQVLSFRTKNQSGSQSPQYLEKSTLGDVLHLSKSDRGEGFMVYHHEDYKFLSPCKVKTPYYVGKKKLMRMVDKNVEKMYNQPGSFVQLLPHEWRFAVSGITKQFTLDQWKTMNAQERRVAIEQNEHFYFTEET